MIKVNGKLIEFEMFPNKETLFKKQMNHILDKFDCVVKFKYEDDSDLIKLMLVKKEIDRVFTGKKILKIMYYPYSRMDRGSEEIVFTLKYISEFINSLNFDEVVIIEPHSDVCLELTNNSKAEFFTIDLLGYFVNNYYIPDYIVLPDAGAYSRYKNKLKGYNVISAEKTRDFETGKIIDLKILAEIKDGSSVVILDDLSSYGGTFIWTAEKLKLKGAGEISLIVAHAEESILKGKIPESDLIKKVFTTNSIINKNQETKKIKIKGVI